MSHRHVMNEHTNSPQYTHCFNFPRWTPDVFEMKTRDRKYSSNSFTSKATASDEGNGGFIYNKEIAHGVTQSQSGPS